MTLLMSAGRMPRRPRSPCPEAAVADWKGKQHDQHGGGGFLSPQRTVPSSPSSGYFSVHSETPSLRTPSGRSPAKMCLTSGRPDFDAILIAESWPDMLRLYFNLCAL